MSFSYVRLKTPENSDLEMAGFEKSSHPLVFMSKSWVRASGNFHMLAQGNE